MSQNDKQYMVFADANKAQMMCDILNDVEVKSAKPPLIRDFIVMDSKTWYHLAPNQVTIPLDARLSNKGLEEKERILRRVVNEQPKKIFDKAVLRPLSAGMWCPDPTSPWYSDDQLTMLNSMVNLCIYAETDEGYTTTSPLIWRGKFTDGTHWGVTRSGSLYYWNN
jgi:hypothetical protein